jgi:hypothetical protein
LWDTADESNNRTVVVTSYNTFASQFGPAAQSAWSKRQNPEYQAPESYPPRDDNFPDSPYHRYRGIVGDEPQYVLRNETSYWTTIRWADAPQVWLFSGSPAPRGVQDFGSYLGLIEHQELAKLALEVDEESGYYPERTNPYELPDTHPASKYRFTQVCFRKWIIENDNLDDYEKGMAARKVLLLWVLRRDYGSACPIGSDRIIAKNFASLTHYSLDRVFSPTAQENFDRGFETWKSRMVIK